VEGGVGKSVTVGCDRALEGKDECTDINCLFFFVLIKKLGMRATFVIKSMQCW
jgi:hypothetical protein